MQQRGGVPASMMKHDERYNDNNILFTTVEIGFDPCVIQSPLSYTRIPI